MPLASQRDWPERLCAVLALLASFERRQDGYVSQVQDVAVLARAANCNRLADRIFETYSGEIENQPTGHDNRIWRAVVLLGNLPPLQLESLHDEVKVIWALAIEAGCYDADDSLRETLPEVWR